MDSIPTSRSTPATDAPPAAAAETCPACGAPLAAGRAQGLCPRCLLARAARETEPSEPASGAAGDAPALETLAAAFPQLEILDPIGRGGMGVVYRARQRSLNRLVALKLLVPGRGHDPAFAERFAREARALAALNHPNIVTIHDFGFAPSAEAGPAGGFYFLLMEYVDGVNLRQAMQAGRFTPEQALAIVPPVCEALQFAHDRGIVHRDIKPENLLLDREGRIKIADFGIARMLDVDRLPTVPAESPGTESSRGNIRRGEGVLTGGGLGTPQYMAPEQETHARQVDHRADIYSLGVVLYELLTGERPGSRLEPPSHKVQIDVRLDAVVLRALAREPELRFANATEFRTQLQTVTAARATAETSPSTPVPVPGFEPSASTAAPSPGILRPPQPSTPSGGPTPGAETRPARTWLGVLLLVAAIVVGLWGVASHARVQARERARTEALSAQLRDSKVTEQRIRQDLADLDLSLSQAGAGTTEHQRLTNRRLDLGRQLEQQVQRGGDIERELGQGIRRRSVVLDLLPALPLLAAALWLLGRPSHGRGKAGAIRPAWVATGAILLAGLAGVLTRSPDNSRPVPPAALADLRWFPVEVKENTVVMQIETEMTGGPVELQASFEGPAVPEENSALPAGLGAGLALARSGPPGTGQASVILAPGRNTWQVGFLFPHAAAAAESYRGLARMELGPVALPAEGWELFHVIASDGRAHVGRLQARPAPPTPAQHFAASGLWRLGVALAGILVLGILLLGILGRRLWQAKGLGAALLFLLAFLVLAVLLGLAVVGGYFTQRETPVPPARPAPITGRS